LGTRPGLWNNIAGAGGDQLGKFFHDC
jgi:hypothetical protein